MPIAALTLNRVSLFLTISQFHISTVSVSQNSQDAESNHFSQKKLLWFLLQIYTFQLTRHKKGVEEKAEYVNIGRKHTMLMYGIPLSKSFTLNML